MEKTNQKDLIGISALLVHAAKIDENYSHKEKKIILNFINKVIDNNSNCDQILKEAENLENNSNQLLNFTNEIKKKGNDFKSSIIAHPGPDCSSDTAQVTRVSKLRLLKHGVVQPRTPVWFEEGEG